MNEGDSYCSSDRINVGIYDRRRIGGGHGEDHSILEANGYRNRQAGPYAKTSGGGEKLRDLTPASSVPIVGRPGKNRRSMLGFGHNRVQLDISLFDVLILPFARIVGNCKRLVPSKMYKSETVEACICGEIAQNAPRRTLFERQRQPIDKLQQQFIQDGFAPVTGAYHDVLAHSQTSALIPQYLLIGPGKHDVLIDQNVEAKSWPDFKCWLYICALGHSLL